MEVKVNVINLTLSTHFIYWKIITVIEFSMVRVICQCHYII